MVSPPPIPRNAKAEPDAMVKAPPVRAKPVGRAREGRDWRCQPSRRVSAPPGEFMVASAAPQRNAKAARKGEAKREA
jgi:hypothetical protein